MRIILNWTVSRAEGSGRNSFVSEQGPVKVHCIYGNEILGSVSEKQFLTRCACIILSKQTLLQFVCYETYILLLLALLVISLLVCVCVCVCVCVYIHIQ